MTTNARPTRATGRIAGTALLIAALTGGCSAPRTSPAGSPSAAPTSTAAATATPGPSTPTPSASATADLAWYGLSQADDLFRGAALASLAGGPAGVVVLGTDRATGALIAWTSSDGDGWIRHWLPGGTFGGGSPDVMAGGPFGYLALGWRLDGLAFTRALWASRDGVAWAPSPGDGLPSGELYGLVGGPAGAAVAIDRGTGQAAIATSRDGRSWHQAALPADPGAGRYELLATPDGFIALAMATDLPSAWRTGDGIAWTADPALASQVATRPNSIDTWALGPSGAVGWSSFAAGLGPVAVTPSGLSEIKAPDTGSWAGQLVAGPAGLVWTLGADRSGGCVVAWQYLDPGWRPIPAAQSDMGCLGAAGPYILGSAPLADGMVIVGTLWSSADRVAWLVRPSGSPPVGIAAGGAVPTPPATSVPDPLAALVPRPATCPAKPATLEALAAIAPLVAVGCFGGTTLSFRAWVVDPGEGYGGTCDPFSPSWIRECVLPDYLLAASRTGEVRLHAMKSPGAKGAISGVGRWVLLQGHYDDAASPTCRYAGDAGATQAPIGLEPELPSAQAVLTCRQVFVVTDIRTVP